MFLDASVEEKEKKIFDKFTESIKAKTKDLA